ncbi:centrosomal protein of 70 kDa [Python bivittatus]|uniref:Centrosomal protein of 70 kDa n=1 Tax=Python bivittatus TaxID=176946 RepID=A0A9F2R9Z3_PYTBI|nr:centrosomal protein of 70 kDa [Python bivittatus]XP_025030415.1 centrosomal protein of 70 kDa [Python bivittatus]XP_025030416.1 centrosomal protein of 70 kDa [Python bivittatus]
MMTEQEQEWENLNKLLRQHGLRPVCLDIPGSGENLSDTERIVMDKQSSQAVQHALKTLMEETERQRKIIRGLIEDNHQLRDELRLERSRASRQEQRANDLDIIVENVKHKIRQLEDESIANASQQHNQVRDLQKDQEISQAVYRHQAKQLQEQEDTVARLQKELSKLGLEEQQRIATQNKMFRQFCKQAPRTHLDQQICCLIDYYESQISQMRKELRKYKKEINHLQEEGKDEEEFLKNIDATANYRALLMSFQTQIIETKARNEQLVHENINLKKEMETRPTVQELKFYKHQVKKLEKILKNIKSLESSEEENMKENRELKKSLGGSQLQEVCRRYLQVLSSIDSIIRSPRRAPLITLMQKKRLGKSCTQENEEESGFEHLPAVIEIWADQLMALKNLHQSLKKLVLQLVPWHTKVMQDTNECIRVEDLQLIVERISEEVNNEEKKSHIPSQQTLYAVVCHFQKLFDVKTLNGIYPRMNEVYTKLGEMINAMRNLCDLLELDSSAPPSVLVNTVGKLCSLFNENVAWQVEQLLGTQDIESIIYKLEEYDDFFPAFHALINNLLCILEVRSLTDILPAVQKLKWKVQ